MVESIYKNDYRPFQAGKSLPRVSTVLDSVRAYQFEIQFFGLPPELAGQQQDLTLAAKQVSPVDYSVDVIEVKRINDKLYYPGQSNHGDLTVTFDNLYLRDTAKTLWNWFKTIYDPLTGDMTKLSAPGGSGNRAFKANKLRIIELDNTRTPHSAIELYGVWPSAVKFAEKNYSTNEFHTIEVTFKYDFMDYFNYAHS
tara:strand:- start:15157 stop:15747 length:591 start_codon:yes stop_codon:yes gene_type:complete